MALLNAAQVAEVEACIAAVEAKSAGELVVAVVSQSSRYDLPRCVCTGAWTLGTLLLVNMSALPLGAEFLLLAQLPLWLIFWQVLGLKPLLRRLTGGLHTDRVVQRRAMQLFTAHGLYRTREHTGLLVMISELEHRVVILADTAIDQRIGQTGWQAHVDRIVQGIQQDHTAAAVVAVLQSLGEVLAQHFPPRPDDTNELSNRVIIEP